MLKQFLDLKKKHPDALLLFRCGDFYETYMQDAEKSSKILGITLTKSSKTKDPDGKPLAMAGFPYHALDTYLPKHIVVSPRPLHLRRSRRSSRRLPRLSPRNRLSIRVFTANSHSRSKGM